MKYNLKFIYFIILIGLSGCADPTYLPSSSSFGDQQAKDFGACRLKFENSGTCVDWVWEKPSDGSKLRSILFKTYRLNLADGSPVVVDQASLPRVYLSMPGMGHGTFATMEALDIGTYRAGRIRLNMGGEWQILFQIKNGDTVVDEAIVNIQI